jgi:hypothetical protein
MFNKRKAVIIMIILALGFSFCLFYGIRYMKNADNSNPYFFVLGTTSATYDGYFVPLSGNEIKQDITLNISLLTELEDGALYTLKLTQLDVKDAYDKISLGHEHLGYFYVTKDIIYRKSLSYHDGFTDYEKFLKEADTKNIELIKENKSKFLDECDIVCTEDGTEDIIIDGEWHKFVEVDGEKRVFQFYSEYTSGTRQYERIVWEKGKGIVHYQSGAGTMLMHVEFTELGY